MKNIRPLLSNAAFAIQIFLLFLWIFESRVEVPVWLQPLGRMHPLMLHFPIVLWVLLAGLPLLKRQLVEGAFESLQTLLLHFAVILTSFTALMGFLLAKEGGYGADAMQLHKWGGLILSFVGYGLLIAYPSLKARSGALQGILLGVVLLLIGASHFGAELTHGENFVFAPLAAEDEKDLIDPNQPIAQELVLRVLDSKCTSCHNPRKSKGGLDMSSLALLAAGGENGPVIKAHKIDESPLIQRTLLPLDHEEHMPPEGKSQLTEAELALLHAWIETGADEQLALDELAEDDPLYLAGTQWIASQGIQVAAGPQYTFEAVPSDLIRALNTPFRRVSPLTLNSPALEASIFVRKVYNSNSIKELLPIKQQLVSLNLSQLPVTDEDLKLVAQFPNLEKLILNGTDISTEGLAVLSTCEQLQSLAISSTAVDPEIGKMLDTWPNLSEVFVWNTKLTPEIVKQLAQQHSDIAFELGYIPDPEEILSMSPPQFLTEKQVLKPGEKVEFKHNFPGAKIHYTTDGTDPDSLTGTLYEEPFELNGYTVVKAMAFLEGWLSSRTINQTYFSQGAPIVDAKLLTKPHQKYQGSGSRTLIDREKGDANTFQSPFWLGYKNDPFSAILDMGEQPGEVGHIVVSYAQNISSYIMPPKSIEIWAGMSQDQLKRVARIRPNQPREELPNEVSGIDFTFEPDAYRYFKIVASPVNPMPSWHRGAGDKGWVFVDEIIVY